MTRDVLANRKTVVEPAEALKMIRAAAKAKRRIFIRVASSVTVNDKRNLERSAYIRVSAVVAIEYVHAMWADWGAACLPVTGIPIDDYTSSECLFVGGYMISGETP